MSIYIALSILLHIPSVQAYTGAYVAKILRKTFGTEITISNINLGFLNRVIIDDFNMLDKSNKDMLHASRVSISIDILELAKGNISISSAQIFGLRAKLYKKDKYSQPNFQFVIDSLSSDKKEESELDLRINSFIIRNGAIQYDQWDMPNTSNKLSPYHIHVSDISSHIIIRHITNDMANAIVKKLSFKEQSGLNIGKLTFSALVTPQKASVKNFRLCLPHSTIYSDSITATYRTDGGSIVGNTIKGKGNIIGNNITLSDFAFIVPELNDLSNKLNLVADFSYTDGKAKVSRLSLYSQDTAFKFNANGMFTPFDGCKTWKAKISQLSVNESYLALVFKAARTARIDIPTPLTKLKAITAAATCETNNDNISACGNVNTNLGNIQFAIQKRATKLAAEISAGRINLNELLADNKFGNISANLHGEARIHNNKITDTKVRGRISDFEYNKYTYKDIDIDGAYNGTDINGRLNVNDENCHLSLIGSIKNFMKSPISDISMDLKNINPQRLNITNKWGDARFSTQINICATGKSLYDLTGKLQLKEFSMQSPTENYSLNELTANINKGDIDIKSDIGEIEIRGKYQFSTIGQSMLSIIKKQLPTAPGIERNKVYCADNNFSLKANIYDTKWIHAILGIPYTSNEPIHIKANINDMKKEINADVTMPGFTYAGESFKNAKLNVKTVNDSLIAECNIKKIEDKGKSILLNVKASAIDNKLNSHIDMAYNSPLNIRGTIETETSFYNDANNEKSAYINIKPSTLSLNDTIWHISPSSIVYNKDKIQVNHFAIGRDRQFIKIYGKATSSADDSLRVDLQNVDVNYILNLINFHSVTFGGQASGTAYLKSIMQDPDAWVDLTVDNFKFQDGRMGKLFANVKWNKHDKQIDIDAHADDDNNVKTIIKGYVSPEKNYIDLGITAHNTNIEFLKSFCGSFMNKIDAHANGFAQVFGDLSEVNLQGLLVADGTIGISPLNTVYRLKNDTIRMVPDEIIFKGDTVTDRHGNVATVTGALHHKHLTRLTFDLGIHANKFLCYDFNDYGNNSFYGTVYGTGDCNITGRPHSIVFDIDMTPNKGSFIEYNAASPDAITDSNFLRWVSHETPKVENNTEDYYYHATKKDEDEKDLNDASDMFINFNVAATPDFTLRVLMDKATGDKISLNGNGALKATYFNKGSFDMYGTYVIDHGSYNLTIQNIIKKDFRFQQGSNIVFGGNPFNSQLNLKAIYPVNGVSLADLRIGNSFSSNNVKVDCIMNIGGTPETIKVDFDFDMPTVNNDAKQMVRSLINSEEEMNQQVVYLLAIGRFYTDSKNNSKQEDAQQSQTSLAMQSLLSGTISQQVNNILGTLIKNNNWNFGTNISTGTEGFNNAEYEGLLSGSLFSNRLLINGQFGYRDNPNTTSSFIGDFDVKYLLTPNGSVAIKVYNQTNDRYFTKSSLNTQGLGIILKKDFKTWWDLFKTKKKKIVKR